MQTNQMLSLVVEASRFHAAFTGCGCGLRGPPAARPARAGHISGLRWSLAAVGVGVLVIMIGAIAILNYPISMRTHGHYDRRYGPLLGS